MKYSFCCLLLVAICTSVYASEEFNLTFIKHNLIRYHDSNQYANDIKQVDQNALEYLKTCVSQNEKTNKKIAIVLDIDETSLSNYEHLLAFDFARRKQDVVKYLEDADDPAIPDTLQLYNYAKEKGVAVFFITGRSEKLRKATVKNLRNVGYQNWDGLFLKPDDDRQESNSPFKSSAREKISKQGYDIVLNIGDQYCDSKGGYSGKFFKLPNPYYYLP